MAERRMFAKTIIDSDAFLDMPLTTQALYFHLSMRADDDGFLNNPMKVLRMVGCNKNDLDLLVAKRFLLTFESGIVVIKHWRIHNYIQKDRYKETVYIEEKKMLETKDNGTYKLTDTECIQDVSSLEAQVRLGKVSLELEVGKDIIGDKPHTTKFIPPTVEQVQEYCKERNNTVDAEKFVNHYAASNWFRGKTKIKNWKACVITWEKNEQQQPTYQPKQSKSFSELARELSE